MANRIRITEDGWRFLVALLKASGYADSPDDWSLKIRLPLKQEFFRLENPESAPNDAALNNIALRIHRLCPHQSKHAAKETTIQLLAQLEGLNDPEIHKKHDSLFRAVVDKNERISLRLLLLRLSASAKDGTEPVGGFVLKDQEPDKFSRIGSLLLEVFVASLGGKKRTGFLPVAKAPSVHSGQTILIRIRLSGPAYIYVFWIRPSGEVQPIFPWAHGIWNVPFDLNEAPLSNLELPRRDSAGGFNNWTLESEAGLETLVAFARRRCLSPIERISVKHTFEGLNPFLGLKGIIPGVHVHTFPSGMSGCRIELNDEKIQDVAFARHGKIWERLADWCEVATCFSFVNAGKSAKRTKPPKRI